MWFIREGQAAHYVTAGESTPPLISAQMTGLFRVLSSAGVCGRPVVHTPVLATGGLGWGRRDPIPADVVEPHPKEQALFVSAWEIGWFSNKLVMRHPRDFLKPLKVAFVRFWTPVSQGEVAEQQSGLSLLMWLCVAVIWRLGHIWL